MPRRSSVPYAPAVPAPPANPSPDPLGPGGRDALASARAVAAGDADPLAIHADARERLWSGEPALGVVEEALVAQPGGTPTGALAGVVAGVKDLIAVAGVPRRCGAPDLVDATPQPRHATAVERLAGAGATVLATLKLHALAFGVTGTGVSNPVAPDRIPGGSSSGSAAAVAGGVVHIALGTDSGGSIRIPASCCGVAGLKPTRGRVPTEGVADLAPSLDTVGPLARDTAGCALALAALDPAALGLTGAGTADVHAAVAGLVASEPATLWVGVPREALAAPVDPAVRGVWEDTLDRLRAAGATIIEVDLPTLPSAPVANGTILLAEAAATHAASADRWDAALPRDVARRLHGGRAVTDREVDRAKAVGAALAAEIEGVFEEVGVLCLPTLPCPPPEAGAQEVVIDGQAEPVVTALTRFTNPWNLVGVPAGSVPAGRDHRGAPVGVQLVGPAGGERQVLRAMATVEGARPSPIDRGQHG